MKKVAIVVAQNNDDILDEIRFCIGSIDGSILEHVTLVNNQLKVLEALRGYDRALVFSGNVFTTFLPGAGVELARHVKAMCPNSLFFMYSTVPEAGTCVDGLIPKALDRVDPARHADLANVIVSVAQTARASALN